MKGSSQQATDYGQRITDPGHLAIVEPDDTAWDEFTQRHPSGHLLQSAEWGALKARFGWERRRLAVASPAGLRAGAQVLFRYRLGASVAYVPRGPLFAGDTATDALLLAALDRLARRQRAVFLRIEPNILEDDPSADALHSFLLARAFQPADPIQPRSSIHLDLASPPDRLLVAMSKGHRADIRRAEREGVVVRVGETEHDLDAFYMIMKATGSRAGFAIHSRDYYRSAWELFSQSTPVPRSANCESHGENHARLLLAERGDVPLAAFLIFNWASWGHYLYSGATEEGRKLGANHALQWQALMWAKACGCQRYDFWGIPDALGQAAETDDTAERERLEQMAQADPLAGVFRFKKGFGGRVVRYLPAYDRVYLSPIYALWRRRFGG
jgi:lipid II:glycine glycyltransferase (peptidoglycan interpeptide bridge formation enzyme)